MKDVELGKIYKRKKSDRDIFQELMPYKVTDILLVANYYDAFNIEGESPFSDKIVGEYLKLNMYSAPRFTSVLNYREAVRNLGKRHFNLIIIVAGWDRQQPIECSRAIKEKFPNIPQLMLVNNNIDLGYYQKIEKDLKSSIERIFVWNGSPKVFLAMAKYLEDKKNIPYDTKIGGVKVILLVEDSVRYYSRYLPMIYTEIMSQTQKLFDSDIDDEMGQLVRLRARPKVILVSSYEEAVDYTERYFNNLIGIISDLEFERKGHLDKEAGLKFISYVMSKEIKIPTILQSKDIENKVKAEKLGIPFIDKNSPTLKFELKKFIEDRLGFGDFVFKDASGNRYGKASSIKEFLDMLKIVPHKSLIYHLARNGISTWLMARGEINLAKEIKPYRLDDFNDIASIIEFINSAFDKSELKKIQGRTIKFHKNLINSNRYIIKMGKGSLGGKGRGLAFLSNFIENVDMKNLIPNLKVEIPHTAIVGVREFSSFIEDNELENYIFSEMSYIDLLNIFSKSSLSENLRNDLKDYIDVVKRPIAIRSSGLFEDALGQPFAGVYSTYLIPNNSQDDTKRLQDLELAIKLVYASVYSKSSKNYFKAIDSSVADEKMAIILQEVIGQEYNGKYYPTLSGVAQSYNYYPFSYIKPEDGFSAIAVGLGSYVVGGEKVHRFCPRYPKLKASSLKDTIKDSQTYFYAIDMASQDYDLVHGGEDSCIKKYDIKDAENDGNLRLCAEVYDYMNDAVTYDFNVRGPRIINFSSILQYEEIPLAHSIDVLLKIFSEAMGSPIEMEFCMNNGDDGKPILYLLQIKPLIRKVEDVEVDMSKVDKDRVILSAKKGMGNGSIKGIKNILYVIPEKFDKLKTQDIAKEVSHFNDKFIESGEEYVLIGPGRWGTHDPLTGIPVLWSDISKAAVIVEQGLEGFPLEASLGSHFFHNVTSMNIGYLAIPYESEDSFINFGLIKSATAVSSTEYVVHIQFDKEINILMDGKTQNSIITI